MYHISKSEFTAQIRYLVSEGRTEEALDLLLDKIKSFTPFFMNDVVMLKSQFVSAKSQFLVNGIIDNSELSRINARVNLAILEIISKVESHESIIENHRKGHLLYKIPSKMIKGEEVKCIVRIAYMLDHLFVDLTIDQDTAVQIIHVTGLMNVELIDDNEENTFEIRTSTDEEQFMVLDECTQWMFKVRPLRIGKFPLLIKIAAVELINGKERKRNIVVEKEISITIENKEEIQDKYEIISLEDRYSIEKEKKHRELKQSEKRKKEDNSRKTELISKITPYSKEKSDNFIIIEFNKTSSNINAGHRMILNAKYVIIGRSDDAIIQFGNDCLEISRNHAVIYMKNKYWVLKNISNVNPTFLNGKMILNEEILTNGSIIHLGSLDGQSLKFYESRLFPNEEINIFDSMQPLINIKSNLYWGRVIIYIVVLVAIAFILFLVFKK